MKIQILSDVHTEFYTQIPKITKTADFIALIGDIGAPSCARQQYFSFIRNVALMGYLKVFVVLGNHEYYNHPPTNKTIDELEKYITETIASDSDCKNVIVLQKKACLVEIKKKKYAILGATLWTDTSKVDSKETVAMSDYKYIYTTCSQTKKPRKINLQDVYKLHCSHKRWLKNKVKTMLSLGYHVVVLTHHKPYLSTIPPKRYAYVSWAYESNSIIEGVKFWGYGHTHIADEITINKTVFVSNPRGYRDEIKAEFDGGRVWRI